MARPRKFDEDELVAEAALAFRLNGYAGTTTRLLEKETGVGIRSLANAFGDKDGLFVLALTAYREDMEKWLERHMSPPKIAGLMSWFRSLAERGDDARTTRSRGCLVGNTIAELEHAPEAVQAELDATRDLLLGWFNAALLAGGVKDAQGRARFLLATYWGLQLQIRHARDARDVEFQIDVLMDTIRGWSIE